MCTRVTYAHITYDKIKLYYQIKNVTIANDCVLAL